MALREIPVDKDNPNYQFSIDLDRRVFLFRITQNARDGRFYLTIKEEDGTVILAGVPLVSNWSIIGKYKDARLPTGNLFVWDSTGGNSDPTEENFGETVFLMYLEEA